MDQVFTEIFSRSQKIDQENPNKQINLKLPYLESLSIFIPLILLIYVHRTHCTTI